MTAQAYLTTAHTVDECDKTTLLELAAHGDQLAWRRLLDEHDKLVKTVARSFRLQSADVSDVVQMTWLRLVQNLHKIRDPERLAGWLAVTAARESLSVLRKASKHRLVPMMDDTPDPADDAETIAADRDAACDLWAAVTELPPRQQVLLVALFRDELDSYNDVAVKCAIPIGSIGPTRARALSHLRRKLLERGLGAADL